MAVVIFVFGKIQSTEFVYISGKIDMNFREGRVDFCLCACNYYTTKQYLMEGQSGILKPRQSGILQTSLFLTPFYMDDVTPSSVSVPEVAPPPLPNIFRKGADIFRAVPVCRSCAIENKLKALYPLAENRICQVSKCENFSSYLAIL